MHNITHVQQETTPSFVSMSPRLSGGASRPLHPLQMTPEGRLMPPPCKSHLKEAAAFSGAHGGSLFWGGKKSSLTDEPWRWPLMHHSNKISEEPNTDSLHIKTHWQEGFICFLVMILFSGSPQSCTIRQPWVQRCYRWPHRWVPELEASRSGNSRGSEGCEADLMGESLRCY